MSELTPSPPDVHFQRITAKSVLAVCHLTDTLSPLQRDAVEDNAESIAQAHFSDNVWMRAIYADDALVGFILLHIGSDYDDGIDCPGVFLWRFMIAGPHQGKGYGRLAIEKLCAHLRALGVPRLFTSCVNGPASPEAFYRRLGFTRTGDHYGDEPELVLELDRP
jgi:diamine N-acetyltransferase